MTVKDLSAFHEVPYERIEGAYVKVAIEKTIDPQPLDKAPTYTTEVRKGEIVGRGNGTGVYYDTEAKEMYETSMGPSIFIDTAKDTTLEVRTNRVENELLEFEP